MSKKTKVAFIYDFDGTLAQGNMQEYGYMKAIGADKDDFWKKTHKLTETNDANNILCYMYLMLKEANDKGITLSQEQFREYGKDVRLFEGVTEWFALVNNYSASIGLEAHHYINSSGLKEIIEGTTIVQNFDAIYASSYLYNSDGQPYWPAVAVDYTTKTQFLFKINKGIKSVSDTHKINEYVPHEKRPIPFSKMIYIGDGTTDVPCMKVVKDHGGHSIAVYKPADKEGKATAERLIRENRVNFATPANYKQDKTLYAIVKRILDKIKADGEFARLVELNNRRFKAPKQQ